ncbi:aldehyde dehydrogenase family protein [Amycolatopsis sp. NPDC023774]|uniref:aldehyde dehydrogenase family protein n=1 Tax=Amycolatopsis sp. NPDC023774 TaxID=3155015 RepID=UPI00340950EE
MTTGGGRPNGRDVGWFVEPTIFADVGQFGHDLARGDFRPVLSVIPYADEADAVTIANDSGVGLGGTVWTTDPDRGWSWPGASRRARSASTPTCPASPRPSAGVKASGMGRELDPGSYQQFKAIHRGA